MTVWVFLPGGETEQHLVDGTPAGLQFFRNNLHHRQVRPLSPAKIKPGAKPGRQTSGSAEGLPRGTTGQALRRELLRSLERGGAAGPVAGDVVVLVDVMDCRFCEPECAEPGCAERFARWHAELAVDVRARSPGVGLVAMLAAPEIEGWFVATAGCPGGLFDRLRARGWSVSPDAISRVMGELGDPEGWGRGAGQGCERKYSLILVDLLTTLVAGTGDGQRPYHKIRDGGVLFANLNADDLRLRLVRYFAPAWSALLAATAESRASGAPENAPLPPPGD